MESVVLVIHLILALSIIGLVLLQRSEGGGLGIGGGGGGLGGLATAKGTANVLTKMTALCATGFFVTSLTLGVLASNESRQNIGLLENVDAAQVEALISDIKEEQSAPAAVTYVSPEEAIQKDSLELLELQESQKQQAIKTIKEEPSAPIE